MTGTVADFPETALGTTTQGTEIGTDTAIKKFNKITMSAAAPIHHHAVAKGVLATEVGAPTAIIKETTPLHLHSAYKKSTMGRSTLLVLVIKLAVSPWTSNPG